MHPFVNISFIKIITKTFDLVMQAEYGAVCYRSCLISCSMLYGT